MHTSTPRDTGRSPRRRRVWIAAAVGVVVLCALLIGGLVFKPWLLLVNTEINDEIPAALTSAPQSGAASPAPIVVSQGQFISHEHTTSGRVSVIVNPDGSRIVAIKGLDTTTGPDVHVWLSAGEVIEGRAGWQTAGDAAHVDLGELKGNRGDQVYAIPAGVDLDNYRAVVLWCVRFSVSFGAAQLLSP